jgi:hypothetical protein
VALRVADLGRLVAVIVTVAVTRFRPAGVVDFHITNLPAATVRVKPAFVRLVLAKVVGAAGFQRIVAIRVHIAGARVVHARLFHGVAVLPRLAVLVSGAGLRCAAGEKNERNDAKDSKDSKSKASSQLYHRMDLAKKIL